MSLVFRELALWLNGKVLSFCPSVLAACGVDLPAGCEDSTVVGDSFGRRIGVGDKTVSVD